MKHTHSTGVRFVYDWYRDFLETLIDADRRFRGFDDAIEDGDVLLRHDVDLSIRKAREMARIESEAGVRSTYFLLVSSPLYNPVEQETRQAIREIDSLGHDIGLHFSTHAYWPPGEEPSESRLRTHVRNERDVLEDIVPDLADTISFHIPPEWVLDRRFDGIDSTYEPAYFSQVDYCSDSRQRWRDDPPLTDGIPDKLQVLTHPSLWGDREQTFTECVQSAVAEATRRATECATREFLEERYSA